MHSEITPLLHEISSRITICFVQTLTESLLCQDSYQISNGLLQCFS